MSKKPVTGLRPALFAAALLVSLSSSPAVAQNAQEGRVLEEIITTAQKREQTLEEVPVSVTAFGQEFIEEQGVIDVRDLAGFTPGLAIAGADTEAAVFIRGIGSIAPGIGADPAVGIFIDGVPSSRGTNATAAFFDVERVEVVKGPQGTLFGRNASAGAISIITHKPDLEESYSDVLLGFGDEGQFRGEFVGNLAVNDRFALRAGIKHDERDGLYYNAFADEDLLDRKNTAIRLSALAVLLDNWESSLSVEKLDFTSNDAVVTDADSFAPVVQQNARPRKAELDSTRLIWTNNWDLSGDMTLVAITGYYDFDVWVQPTDADETEFPIVTFVEPQTNQTFSQELRLNSATEAVDWFVGASFVKEDLAFTTDLNYEEGIVLDLLAGLGSLCQDPGLPACTYQSETPFGSNTTKSYAAYGDFTWHLNDRWDLTAGARYTRDEKSLTYNNPPTGGILGVLDAQIFGPITNGDVHASDTWSSFDPRVAVNFHATDSTSLFVNISKGYKSGGLNRQVNAFLPDPQGLNAFDEESVIAYEIGTKSRFLNDRAALNVSAFFNDYQDFQLETLVDLVPMSINVGDLESYGVELEGQLLVTDSLELAATYGYLQSEMTRSLDTSILGNETPQAPRNSGSLSAHYYIETGPGEWKLSASWQHSDRFWFDIFNTIEQPSYDVIDLRVGYEAESSRWGIAAFADNVTDEEYYAHRFLFLDNANRRAAGRLYRLELTLHF